MSSSSEFNIDPSTCMEADLPKKSVLTVVAHSGDLYNYQPGTQDLLTSNNSEMGGFLVELSWYDLPSFLSHLFPPLSVPCPISVTFLPHPTSSACSRQENGSVYGPPM